MLLFLAFLLSKRGLTCALPILSPIALDAIVLSPDVDITTTASTGACAGRSVWSILWSCLATTFACTWVSVHPNVPFLRCDKMSIRSGRVYLMIISLIAPEIMILWAFKQCQGAVVIMETVNSAVAGYLEASKKENAGRENAVSPQIDAVKMEKTDEPRTGDSDNSRKGGLAASRTDDPQKWSLIHAHYLQMGGFRLHCHSDDKRHAPVYLYRKARARYGGEDYDYWELPLSFETMTAFINNNVIDLPFVQKEEVLDKCGRDALSKTIAMAQLTWFILQIAARVHQDLAVTELELTTAALASLNIAMYISWWSKPTDILCPTIITSKCLQQQIQEWILKGNTKQAPSDSQVESVPKPSSTHNSADNTAHATDVVPKGGKPLFPIGGKARVNLAVHYWSEFRNAFLAFCSKIIQSPWRFITWIPTGISNLLRWVRRRLSESCGEDKPHGPFGKTWKAVCMIWKAISLTWEAFTLLFLALIYYPILAILDSGSNVHSEFTSGKGGNHTTTPEDVDVMPSMSLIFNKHALRLFLDIGFFCEDVASAPFLCFSAFSGAIFGMIHCLAWNFVFPSDVEKLLWRLSSSIITGLCFCIVVVAIVLIVREVRQTEESGASKQVCQPEEPGAAKQVRQPEESRAARHVPQNSSAALEGTPVKEKSREAKIWAGSKHNNFTEIACSAFAICFVLTRLSLLTLSVIGLRDLPTSAFDTVQWSDFIPHI